MWEPFDSYVDMYILEWGEFELFRLVLGNKVTLWFRVCDFRKNSCFIQYAVYKMQ